MNFRILPRLILAVVVIAFCLWQVIPWETSVRLGKDLRGGVSMVYAVDMPEGGDRQRILVQVIDSLKRRVNPQGVLDVSLQPQGLDRIEVVMPLPSAEVRAAGETVRAQVAALGDRMTISPSELQAALDAGNAPDLAPAPAAGASAGPRRQALEQLQASAVKAREARSAYQEALARGADAADLGRLEADIAQAEVSERSARAVIAAGNIDQARLRRAFSLSTVRPRLRDEKGKPKFAEDGTPATGPSPRDLEVLALQAQLPDFAADIAEVAKASGEYAAQVSGYDDPEDLKRLLRGAGVLEFRIAVSAAGPEGVNPDELRKQLLERGPSGTDSPVARWFPINDPKQWGDSPEQIESLLADPVSYLRARDMVGAKYDGQPYALLYTTEAMSLDHLGGRQWSMKAVFPSQDQLGRTCVAFQLDPSGGILMGKLTGANIGRPMGIVLDGQLFSAPTLQSQIPGNGQITGSFTQEEIDYLIRVLQGGELEAKLRPEPISVSILGPALGRENLLRGLTAVVLASIATAVLMAVYYLGAGLIADIAVVLNIAMIFGIMAMIDGSFTLPGLAGIALVVGMAVDANVLVLERTREELVDNKETLKQALDLGFARAFNAIIDGNVTNLIVCVVLYKLAATEVKGFALTMMIGVLTTIFTALYCSRIMMAMLVNWFGVTRMPMLPTLLPGLMKLLRPNVDWLRLRPVMWTLCALAAAASVVLSISAGRELLETEFRGGVTMTMVTRKALPGESASASGRLLLKRDEVERRVHEIVAKSSVPVLAELRSANVLTVGESTPDGSSTGFQVRVANPAELGDKETVTEPLVEAITSEFAQSLDVTMPVRFAGMDDASGSASTLALSGETLGASIGVTSNKTPTRDFAGGVAVVLKDLQPAVTLEDATTRISRMRRQPDFSSISARQFEVVGLELADPSNPDKGWKSLAVMVVEPSALLSKVDAVTWERVVAQPEWRLIQAAFTGKQSLDQVSSFSPVVAANLAASAIVAIIVSLVGMVIYIWLRFSSFRYSAATVIAVIFNVVICLGALALSLRLSGTDLAKLTLLEAFRIDLNVIAALLTIIGYSLNDTIVILDRIRENKGKLRYASWSTVNDSINQTFSRTVMTGGSTLLAAALLYVYGGPAIQPFAFTFIVGLVAGTISSVVIAGPLTYAKEQDLSATADRHSASGGLAAATHA